MSNQYSFVIVSTDCAELLHVNIITVKLPTGDMLLTIFFVPPKIADVFFGPKKQYPAKYSVL